MMSGGLAQRMQRSACLRLFAILTIQGISRIALECIPLVGLLIGFVFLLLVIMKYAFPLIFG
jgi:hypothetical protein